jgi:hypothetical protein
MARMGRMGLKAKKVANSPNIAVKRKPSRLI